MFRFFVHSALMMATAAPYLAASAQTGPAHAGDDLIGLWGANPQLGPAIAGDLLLERRSLIWAVRVGGVEAEATAQGDSVVLTIPGQQGTLMLWTTRATPEAFWLQPAGMNQPFATPVRLRPAGGNAWRGTVTPVPERFPLYLMIAREADGSLRGTFRNPEVNWPGRTHYIVRRSGNTVQFVHPGTGAVQYTQPYDSAARRISFDFGVPIVLEPRTPEQAPGFVTRSPSLAPYRYRTPATLDDGWRTSAAARVGMNEAALQELVRALVAVDPLSETKPRVHSVVVARRGALVLDEYFRGYGASDLHDLRSASKTMTSILAGAAMQQGARLDGRLFSAQSAVGRDGMTLAHLLSHSTGLACNDDDDGSPGNEDTMQSQRTQPDWYAFFMALPKLTAPGTTYSYCSAGMNMAGGMVARATARWLPRLFEQHFAGPMQLGAYGMNLMPTGQAYGGGGMRMTSRDLLKFGQLYLNDGLWRGVQLVPRAWVRASTAEVIARSDGSTDGLGWHRHVLSVGTRQYETYEASGNGGQFLVVVPQLQLAVVVTAGNYGQYAVWRSIREQLLPAVMGTVHPSSP
jgi:CubicO group peptidase (beta-lactamase class C family)